MAEDKIIKEAKDHQDIYEALIIFRELTDIDTIDRTMDFKKLQKFFNDLLLPHFKNEEDDIFPVIVKFGTDAERAIVDELKLEHTQMSEGIEYFDRAFSGDAGADSEKLKEIVRPVLWQVLKHAHKEDEFLFPCLKKYPVSA